MTRPLLTLIGLFTISVTFGQKEINNTRTDNHKQITGTKFFLIPPPGFISATSFQGFQQINSGASLLVMEMPGPFSESTKGFNEQGLKTQGVILKKKEVININGSQGLFLTAEQFAYGTNYSKYILVFGDSKATYMVNGIFPKEYTELDKDIQESMFSVVYESKLSVDPLSAISFTVDTENTKLKFGKSVTGMILYTVDGKVPTESNDKTNFIVGLSLVNVQSIDKKLIAINRIKRMPYTHIKLDENKISEIKIDGISGYELVGEGVSKPDGTKELVYEVMLFTDNGYYIMVGTTMDDYEANLNLFKKVAKTFKRK
ncbi:hypothetical protein [Ohtaekwangia koreensis]|uniref:Uncharacterized protein n=1 Tax=Ohtaekwangia koreensis TaxID=688867 RepID=A0A1T5MG27_9BACT|nr:hypothetical protein [Ohtaekwangia koreensis]SKC86894.1 hypothetical protein SAMN05660236_5283 [Ohtaekwangia koreensis]